MLSKTCLLATEVQLRWIPFKDPDNEISGLPLRPVQCEVHSGKGV